jgi:hypothetical protein
MERGMNGSRNGQARNGQNSGSAECVSSRLLQGLEKYKGVHLVSHINPDPDSLGSMVALAWLIRQKVGMPVQLTRDGILGRAETEPWWIAWSSNWCRLSRWTGRRSGR